jgi:hypothetical protein
LHEKQKLIIELCQHANVSPIAFNQGAWVLGSQIASNYYAFKNLLMGEASKSIIQNRIREREEFVNHMKQLLINW